MHNSSKGMTHPAEPRPAAYGLVPHDRQQSLVGNQHQEIRATDCFSFSASPQHMGSVSQLSMGAQTCRLTDRHPLLARSVVSIASRKQAQEMIPVCAFKVPLASEKVKRTPHLCGDAIS